MENGRSRRVSEHQEKKEIHKLQINLKTDDVLLLFNHTRNVEE